MVGKTAKANALHDYTIASGQLFPSERIHRHAGLDRPYLRPIPTHQRVVFGHIQRLWVEDPRPLVLDSCCGRGMSTGYLHQRFPRHRVLGLDQSAHRLALAKWPAVAPGVWGDPAAGVLLARVNVIDLWRLIAPLQWPIEEHFLWYPNPWPKSRHAKQRFHAHPVFDEMLSLSPSFELRTQWHLYAKEFCARVALTSGYVAKASQLQAKVGHSHFECKYLAANQALWQVRVTKVAQ